MSDFVNQPSIEVKSKIKYSLENNDLTVFDNPLIKGYKKIMILLGCADKEVLSQNVINELSGFENIAVLKETTSNINNASFFCTLNSRTKHYETSYYITKFFFF